MKAAREEADAKQKQMERQMKEETERLKTQFIFKVSRLFFFSLWFMSHLQNNTSSP